MEARLVAQAAKFKAGVKDAPEVRMGGMIELPGLNAH